MPKYCCDNLKHLLTSWASISNNKSANGKYNMSPAGPAEGGPAPKPPRLYVRRRGLQSPDATNHTLRAENKIGGGSALAVDGLKTQLNKKPNKKPDDNASFS